MNLQVFRGLLLLGIASDYYCLLPIIAYELEFFASVRTIHWQVVNRDPFQKQPIENDHDALSTK